MFLKSKFKKNYLTAICMSLVLLMVSTLGFLIETNIRQITPPTTDTWESYITRPSGSASENEPWIINNARELAYLINNINDGTYYIELNSDINLAAHEWTPIKVTEKNSKIIFDGKGHTIFNMKIDTIEKSSSAAFIVDISNGFDSYLTFRNTNFSGVDINSSSSAAAVVSYADGATIENVAILSGNIVAYDRAAGIGSMVWGIVRNCTNNARIYSKAGCAGGIVGHGNNVIGCINSGEISSAGEYEGSSSGCIGGIAGWGPAVNCLNSGTLRMMGKSYVGGITGMGSVENSGFNGTIELAAEPMGVGSIAGGSRTSDTIINSYGVATIQFSYANADLTIINMFGAPQNEKFNNCYSYTKVYAWDQKTTEYRKYKGSDFSNFAYHKNINGGYPFPKSLFAVGHFIDSDILAYFKDYSFTQFNYNFVYEDGLYTMELGRFPQTLVSDSAAKSYLEDNYSSFTKIGTVPFGSGTVQAYRVTGSYAGDYVRVTSSILNPDIGRAIPFSDLKTRVENGKVYWFKIEPIKWILINENNVLNSGMSPVLMTAKVLTSNIAWNKNNEETSLWAYSNMREFLNDSFYNTIFSEKEKSIIQTTRYSSSDEYYTPSQSANTSDNIFLPLRKKIEEGYYQLLPFGLPTDFALVNNLFCGYVNREVQTLYRLGNLMRINNQWATSCILAGGDAPENEVELLTYNGIGISPAITLK